ncbi:MAG: hypothetical protein PPFGHCPK_01449 (plasmid) [Spiroplasma endosymbiont of Drosophila atripex]|nr:MAG: hypothetical protein PPFGHCPK_01449 [Spiroplasma endosymbiont of Drosophila atripex]
MNEQEKEQGSDDIAKPITKRASKIKFVFSNAIGGIGIADVIILLFSLVFIVPILSLMAEIGILVSIFVTFGIFLFTLLLIQVNRNGDKFYYLLWVSIKYLFINKETKQIFSINQIKSIKNNEVYFKNNFGLVFRIEAQNINLQTQNERNIPISKLANIFKLIDIDFEIIKAQIPYNFDSQKENINNLLKVKKKEKIVKQLENMKNFIVELEKEKQLKNSHYLFLYAKNINEIKQKTKFILNEYDKDIKFTVIDEIETSYLISKLIVPNNYVGVFEKKPSKIKQYKDYIKIDDKYVSYLTISTYPTLVNDFWLMNFANLDNVNLNIKFTHVSQHQAIELLDRAIRRAEMQKPRKTSEENKYETYLNHFHELLNLVQNGGETLKMVSIIFTCFANNKNDLNNIKQILKNELSTQGFIENELKYMQLDTYKFIWNNSMKNKKYITSYWQEMGCLSIASAWPFLGSSLNDEKGLYMGNNENGEPIFFDVKTKNKQEARSNGNVVVFGLSGCGKTFNVKKQLNWLYLNNSKIYIIDPEQEYHNFAKYYGGEIIAIGQTNKSLIINPLEIFTGNLMEHISFLEQFFKILYKDLTDNDLSDLQKLLLKIYKTKNIDSSMDFETLDNLKSKDFPTLKDLFNEQEKNEKIKEDKSTLYKILWKLAKGADGYLWNGHTNLSLKNELIVFDIHDLSTNKNRQNAQMFLMLAFLEKVAKHHKKINEPLDENKRQWLCIAIDEAHLLVNESNLLALNFVSGLAKRIRKYYGSIYIITQNINDFVGSVAIKTQAQAIINNCVYQFVHRLASSDLQDYDNLISASGRLNKYQKQIISNAPIGTCLFSINNNRMMINIQTSEYEQEAIKK